MALLAAMLALTERGARHNETKREMASSHVQPFVKAMAAALEDASCGLDLAAALMSAFVRLSPAFPGPMRPFKDTLHALALPLCWTTDAGVRHAAAELLATLPRVVGVKDMAAAWATTCGQLVASIHHVGVFCW